MVTRGWWLPALLLLGGCPDGIGGGGNTTTVVVSGLLAPSDLAVEVDGGSRVLLSWTDHATNETGFRLEMSSTPYANPTIADVRFLPADATSLVYPTVPNSVYYFRVFAITSTMESEPSNDVGAQTPDVPIQPTGLVAYPRTSSEIELAWDDVPDESSYVIERSSDGGATWVSVGQVAADTVTFISGGMSGDTEVAHRVVALKRRDGRSTPSDPALAQTTTASMQFFFGTPSGGDGQFTSIVVEPGGREHIAHYDAANGNVLYTSRPAASGYATITVDTSPSGVGGDGTAIAVDPTGKVHIVAHDRWTDRPRYLTNGSGPWTRSTLDTVPSGAQPRIVCNASSGELQVTYLDSAVLGLSTDGLIRYTRKMPGGSWTAPKWSPYSTPTARHSLALDPTGAPVLLCVDPRNDLRIYVGTSWLLHSVVPTSFPAQPLIGETTMAVDAGGAVHLAFHEKSSGALYFGTAAPGWDLETVDQRTGHDLGSHCSLAVQDSTGRVHLAYYDATRKDLRYARKDPGGPWVKRIIEALGDVGSHASIAVDGAGKVYIAYRDETQRRLKVAVGTP